ncbi:hypothetical protein F0562_022487 [Nyssa sinensis]|uniref:Uncharacterized protein n=1 Tax=Nyssa sinensis TaxID=561372 RepID=A0A5J5BMW8_9ASTE|nr:hypothetical protein F0562_022487 [Nyssa sinensis]
MVGPPISDSNSVVGPQTDPVRYRPTLPHLLGYATVAMTRSRDFQEETPLTGPSERSKSQLSSGSGGASSARSVSSGRLALPARSRGLALPASSKGTSSTSSGCTSSDLEVLAPLVLEAWLCLLALEALAPLALDALAQIWRRWLC